MRILFAGKKRAGKDESAKWFIDNFGGQTASFAEPIYRIMYFYQDTLGIPRHKDREFLQKVGSLARKNNPNVWVDLLRTEVDKLPASQNVFITDGRYENELDSFIEDFILVHVVCPEEIRKTRLDPNDSVNDNHESENGFPPDYPFDFTVVNDGSIESLHAELQRMAEKIKQSLI